MPEWDQIEGGAKEKAGEFTDDRSLEREGEAQEAWGDVKDKVDDVADDVRDRI